MRFRPLALVAAAGLSAILLASAGVPPAGAMGSSDPPKESKAAENADYAAGRAAIEKKDWAGAVASLRKAVAAEPQNADAFNYLGYAQRNAGDLAGALDSYQKALAIDPKHRGAHEYLGEAYLMQKDLPKAEEMLARLDKLCTFGCAEYRELKAKVAEYKKKQSS